MQDVSKTAKRIKKLEIQGAKNIAIAALKALGKSIKKAKKMQKLLGQLRKDSYLLSSARPTEPALRNGLDYVTRRVHFAKNIDEAKNIVISSIEDYIKKMEEAEEKIIEVGIHRIKQDNTILVHCHSSNVMNILKNAWKKGTRFKVICTETRPLFQGRITAKELLKCGIPVTMIVDSAARTVMNDVDLVIFGADAVSADGFIINKIGTSQIALAAKEARTMTACVCETFKFDPITLGGEYEPIEVRSGKEIWEKAPKKLKIYNPAFDVTPPNYVNFLITEEGIITPYEAGHILREKYHRGANVI